MLSNAVVWVLAVCISQMAAGFVIRTSPATQNRELQQKRTRRPRLPKLAPVPHTRDTRQSPKTIVQSLDPDAVYVSDRVKPELSFYTCVCYTMIRKACVVNVDTSLDYDNASW
jgi:hypothetical protein